MYVCMCAMQCYMGSSPTECDFPLCLLNLILLYLFWKTLTYTEIRYTPMINSRNSL